VVEDAKYMNDEKEKMGIKGTKEQKRKLER
jgi:hypothetical protein